MNLEVYRVPAIGTLFVVLAVPGLGEGSEFIPLGDFPEGSFGSSAQVISDDGTTVLGNATFGDEGEAVAFRWTEADGIHPLAEYSRELVAAGATNNGSVVVGHEWLRAPISENAINWTADDGVQTLSGFSASVTARATDVSPDGAFIVGIAFEGVSNPFREAFLWDVGAGAMGLGDLPGGFDSSNATAVSADGSAVVGTGSSTLGSEAYLWTAEEGMTGLGELPGGDYHSSAKNVSADGRVVVGSSTSDPLFLEAFRWSAATGMVGLGSLPGFEESSSALAANGDGSIVVGTVFGEPGELAAFVWDDVHGMRFLEEVLINDFYLGESLDGWTLRSARDISADGLSIVGQGRNPNGDFEAYLVRLDHPLTAPEPSSLALLLMGGVFVSRRRIRR